MYWDTRCFMIARTVISSSGSFESGKCSYSPERCGIIGLGTRATLNVWSVIRVFLFDTIYGRVKRLTKRMTSRLGDQASAPGGRASHLLANFVALRHAEWVTVASAHADETDQSARGTDWNGSWDADDDLRGSHCEGMNTFRSVFIRLRANKLVRVTKYRQLMSSLCVWYRNVNTWLSRV